MIAISPVAMTSCEPIKSPLPSTTVRLPAVMLAVRFATLVLSDEEFWAVTFSRPAVTWLANCVKVTLPEVELRATLPVPAFR